MPRLFIYEKLEVGDEIVVSGEEAHHIIRVLRLGHGDLVSISDGKSEESVGVISEVDTRSTKIKIRVLYKNKFEETKPTITLLQGLPKGEKFDWIIQKCTEIGVSRIVPIITQRTVVNIAPAKLEHRMMRWKKIAEEAAKQSMRMDIPEIVELLTFDEALKEIDRHHLSIIPWEQERDISLKKVLKDIDQSITKVAVFIGPEGGFSPDEAEMARTHGAVPVSLGPRILRTETAAIAACSILMYELGGMGG